MSQPSNLYISQSLKNETYRKKNNKRISSILSEIKHNSNEQNLITNR